MSKGDENLGRQTFYGDIVFTDKVSQVRKAYKPSSKLFQ